MEETLSEFQSFRLPLFLGALLLLALVETLIPSRVWKGNRGKRWFIHLGLSFMNTFITRLVAWVPLVLLLELVQEHSWGLKSLLGLTGAVEVITTLLFYDLFYYAWHRANHELPFLWRFHAVHHVDTQLDVTTSLRFHPVELLLSFAAKALWIVIWGPSLFLFLLGEALATLAAQYHHTNFSFPAWIESRLSLVNMTPRLHTSHHTVTPRTREANYATILSIWDRLLGTYQQPDSEELKTLGLKEGRESDLNLKWLLTVPFQKVL